MAIDETQPVRAVSRQLLNGTTVSIRVGVDDGADFAAGTVVYEENGVLRLATTAEASNYFASNTAEAGRASLLALAADVAGVAGGLPEIKAYLLAKFPEDFS